MNSSRSEEFLLSPSPAKKLKLSENEPVTCTTKKYLCEVCSKPDCMKCSYCLEKSLEKCLTYLRWLKEQEQDEDELRYPVQPLLLPALVANYANDAKDLGTQPSLESVLSKVSSKLSSLSEELNKLKAIVDNALGITANSSSFISTPTSVAVSTITGRRTAIAMTTSTYSNLSEQPPTRQAPAVISTCNPKHYTVSTTLKNSLALTDALNLSSHSKAQNSRSTESATPVKSLLSQPKTSLALETATILNKSESSLLAITSTNTPPVSASPSGCIQAVTPSEAVSQIHDSTLQSPPHHAKTGILRKSPPHTKKKLAKVAFTGVSPVSTSPDLTLAFSPHLAPQVQVVSTSSNAVTSKKVPLLKRALKSPHSRAQRVPAKKFAKVILSGMSPVSTSPTVYPPAQMLPQVPVSVSSSKSFVSISPSLNTPLSTNVSTIVSPSSVGSVHYNLPRMSDANAKSQIAHPLSIEIVPTTQSFSLLNSFQPISLASAHPRLPSVIEIVSSTQSSSSSTSFQPVSSATAQSKRSSTGTIDLTGDSTDSVNHAPTASDLTSTNPSLSPLIASADMEGIIKTRIREAFSKIEVNFQIVKCGISGPPGCGKTHFKALLLNQPRPKCRHSTPLSTKAKEVTTEDFINLGARRNGIFKWTVLKKDKWASLLANTIYNHTLQSHSSEQIETLLKFQSHLDEKYDDLGSTVSNLLLKMYSNSTNRIRNNTINNIHLLYIVDTGGQPQFQEILPNFVRCSMNFLVHKLSEKLLDCPKFEYVINHRQYTLPDPLRVSNLSIIEQSVRSVCASNRSGSVDESMVAIVGTFKDEFELQIGKDKYKQEAELKRKGELINARLKAYVEQKERKCGMMSSSRSTGIFSIDASERGWDHNTEVMEDLKNKTKQFIEEKVEAHEIPISYFVFLQNLRLYSKKHNKHYLCMTDIQKINQGSFFSLSENNIKKALCFFSEVNLILYFPNSSELSDVIFMKPSFLYDRVTEIIVSSFPQPNSPLSRRNYSFYMSGVFTYHHLHNIPSLNFSGYPRFTKEIFLSLLQDLFIIAKLDSSHYFMPCVLPLEDFNSLTPYCKQQLDNIKHYMNRNEVSGPLVISFGDKITPRGLFCAMVTRLSKNFGWQLNEDENVIRRRNMIEFSVYDNSSPNKGTEHIAIGTALICDRVSNIELYTTCEKQYCWNVRNAVILSLYEAGESLKYSFTAIDVFVGFYCDACPTVNHHHKNVFRNKDSNTWVQKCSYNTRKRAAPISSGQKVWFENPDPVNSSRYVPITNIREVFEAVIPYTNKWEAIGLQLEMKMADLERIGIDKHTEEDRFRAVFIKWQNNDVPSFTWATLVGILKSPNIQEHYLARRIEENYMT